jgi:uncharacterized protein
VKAVFADVTTDEVLCEYLTFFAGARPSVRAQADANVAELINSADVLVIPQSRESFLAGLELYRVRPTKATAWSIAFRCRRCARKD